MTEKRTLSIAMMTLLLSWTGICVLLLLFTLFSEEICFDIQYAGTLADDAGKFLKTVAGNEIIEPTGAWNAAKILLGAIWLTGIVFLVFAGIFLAKCYLRLYPGMKKSRAYLVSFGCMLVYTLLPIWLIFFVAFAFPVFKSRKKTPIRLWWAATAFAVVFLISPFFGGMTAFSHILFYGLPVFYVLALLLMNSLAEEGVGRTVRSAALAIAAVSLSVCAVIVGCNLILENKVRRMEADFRSHGIPVGIREFDTHLASGKLDNADTAKFAGLLKKAGGLEKKGTDVSKFMEEFEKYSSDDHLLGKENFGRHLFDRSFGHYSAISTVSRIYKKRMDETKSADELIRQFQHWGRLSKFLGDDEAGAIRAANVEADRLKTFAVNVKRFALDGRQKALILSELRELENRLHAVYSRAAASLPMLLFDSIDAVAAGQTEETRGLDFFKMNPVIGAPFRNYALKSKLHGRGYIDLITRKINVRKDLCQLPEVSYLPEDRVCRGNMFVTLAMHDLSPYLDKKYRTIFLARCLAMIVSGEPQTDPFTGKRIVRKNGHSDPHDLDGFTVDGERNL